MSGLVPLDLHPDEPKLRRFALAWLGFLGVIWPVLLLLRGHARTAGIVAAVGVAGAVLGWFVPRALRPAWVVLIVVSWPIGFVVTNVALAVLYFLVISPIGLVARLRGRDPLHLKQEPVAKSAWRRREKADMASYLRQH